MDGDDRGPTNLAKSSGRKCRSRKVERLASGEMVCRSTTARGSCRAPGVRREARARDLCYGAASLRVLRKAAASQGLHEPDNRTVFGTVVVKTAMDGLPALLSPLSMAFTVLGEIARPTTPTHGVNARLAACCRIARPRALGRVLPIEPTRPSNGRKRTLTLGPAWKTIASASTGKSPPACEHKQLESDAGDPARIRRQHRYRSYPERGSKASARLEIVIARAVAADEDAACHYLRRATLPSLNAGENAASSPVRRIFGHGEVRFSPMAPNHEAVAKGAAKPTTHIIDWFHLAMTIRPCGNRRPYRRLSADPLRDPPVIDEEIKA